VGYQRFGMQRVFALLLCNAIFVSVCAHATVDAYDAAVANPGRPATDLKRDPTDNPAAMLRLAGIKPGMRVADLVGGSGYYSELLSYLVGPKGRVLLINNKESAQWSSGLEARLADNRLPNVENETADLNHMNLSPASLDAVLMVKIYHDLYWVDPKEWPQIDVGSVLDQVATALKFGGVVLVIDHSAKAGTGTADAGRLHRIDEAYALKDFERHGFKLVDKSDLLKRPDDARDQLTYKGPMLGKTDRFVLLFRKSG
jgi:predicted methyltransferase